jgi:hypothetical protein
MLTPADDRPGGGPDGWATVISYQFWVQHYHADPAVVGRQVTVNDHGMTIVGVAPARFEGIIVTSRPDFYMPLEYEPVIRQPFGDSMLHRPGNLWLTPMARLKPGVTLGQASAEVSALSHLVIEDTLPPQARNLPVVQRARFAALPGRSGWSYLRQQYTRPLLLIQMLVGAVLLISCANLAGLGLARASAWQHEFALRVTLGAARTRMLRQMLVESFLLAIPGALLGLGFAWGACRMLMQRFAGDAWSTAQATLTTRPDTRVLFATAGCSILCALLFGIAPAWIASRTALEPALRRTGNGSTRSERSTTNDCEIVGVAGDARLMDLRGPAEATVYRSVAGDLPNPGLWNFLIRSQSLADARTAYLTALHELAPGKAEFELIPVTVQLDESVSIERLLAQLSGFFAGLALLLSAIGIYGLVAWSVAQRTREIGVRMALGATRMRVFAMVMRQVAVLLTIGVAAGGVAGVLAARSICSFLFEVQPGNPEVFVAAALALVLIGLLAAMLPARRAVSVDPMRALRTE